MRNERGRIEYLREDDPLHDDKNGRVIACVYNGSGPTWDQIWADHKRRNWANRDRDDDQDDEPVRRAYLKRRG